MIVCRPSIRVTGFLFLSVVIVFTSGCVTAPKVSKSDKAQSLPIDRGGASDDHAAAEEVALASQMIETTDPSEVIPRLLNVMSKYPASQSAMEARYWLGLAYYKIGGFRDAIDLFNEYVKLAPKGKYAEKAANYVAQISEEYNQKFPTAQKLDEAIDAMAQEVAKAPDDLAKQLELADLLWKRGDYTDAGLIYKAVVAKRPEYAKDAAVAARVEFLPNGECTLLTPLEIQRRQAEAQPLIVINTSSFHSGRDLFTREQRFYSVTGQVVNRGDSVLYGVQVVITLYGFGNAVFDTNTVSIGRMNPNEVRAFSVRFSNFDNIENVNRYECVATFQR